MTKYTIRWPLDRAVMADAVWSLLAPHLAFAPLNREGALRLRADIADAILALCERKVDGDVVAAPLVGSESVETLAAEDCCCDGEHYCPFGYEDAQEVFNICAGNAIAVLRAAGLEVTKEGK